MEKQMNIPLLRFPEFKDNWEKHKFGEIAIFSKGKGISKADIVENGAIECIRYGELYTTYGETISDVKSRTNIDANDLVFSEANDVIIPASGETQIDIATASCVLRNGIALGGDLNVIKTKNNGVFLSYYLNYKKKLDIASLAQGISVVHLYSSQLSLIELNLPSNPEQDKIAVLIRSVDDKINVLKKKKCLLEKYKKGIMQKLFSQQLRFKDDNGTDFPEWEKKKITDIANTAIGLVTTMTTSYVDVGIPLIRNSDIKENRVNKTQLIYLDEAFALKHKHKKFQLNDIVTVHTGDIGISAVIDESLVGCLGFATLNTRVNTDYVLPEFVCIYYNTPKSINYAISVATGDGRSNYNLKDFDNAIIPVPSIKEQRKISRFLLSIYKNINNLDLQIKQIENWKKGTLQKMFC
ncbi:MAG: restriction endonuclease subunit S [Flavobacterium sp.]|nr:restriction endonuclease subunit S [Flavobacterium sp.]